MRMPDLFDFLHNLIYNFDMNSEFLADNMAEIICKIDNLYNVKTTSHKYVKQGLEDTNIILFSNKNKQLLKIFNDNNLQRCNAIIK